MCPSEQPQEQEAGRHAAALRYTPPDAPKVVANGTGAVADAIVRARVIIGPRVFAF